MNNIVKHFDPNEADKDMLSNRIIYISGGITPDVSNKFGKAIVWLNSQSTTKDIAVYIDSPGGSVSAGLDIYDMMKHSSAPITGIVYRRAHSMASLILQGCKTRCALPHADLLVHSIRLNELPLSEIEKDFEKALKKSRELQYIVNEIYKKRIGCSMRAIEKMNTDDKLISAKEAFDIGLIDIII